MRKLHQFVCLNVIKRWKACHNKLLNRHCHLLKETPEVTGGSVHFLLADKGSVLLWCQWLSGGAGMCPDCGALTESWGGTLAPSAAWLCCFRGAFTFSASQRMAPGCNRWGNSSGVGAGIYRGEVLALVIFVRHGAALLPGLGEGTSCGFIIWRLSAGTGNHNVILCSPLRLVLGTEYLHFHRPAQNLNIGRKKTFSFFFLVSCKWFMGQPFLVENRSLSTWICSVSSIELSLVLPFCFSLFFWNGKSPLEAVFSFNCLAFIWDTKGTRGSSDTLFWAPSSLIDCCCFFLTC